MGVEGPRTPAVHRAVRMLDAIWTGQADTPTALGGMLGLAKSSVADLLGALENEGLIRRSEEGNLSTGGRWASLADPDGAVDRLFRACGRTPDLDGHTLSVIRLQGAQAVCLDVRPGQHPLPLTPRPGQFSPAGDSAGAIAVLSTLTAQVGTQLLREAAGHQGLTDDTLDQTLALRQVTRGGTAELLSDTGLQVACAVPGTPIALIIHVPERFSDPAFIRKITRALTSAVNEMPDNNASGGTDEERFSDPVRARRSASL